LIGQVENNIVERSNPWTKQDAPPLRSGNPQNKSK
jgi:hypothetical protein